MWVSAMAQGSSNSRLEAIIITILQDLSMASFQKLCQFLLLDLPWNTMALSLPNITLALHDSSYSFINFFVSSLSFSFSFLNMFFLAFFFFLEKANIENPPHRNEEEGRMRFLDVFVYNSLFFFWVMDGYITNDNEMSINLSLLIS